MRVIRVLGIPRVAAISEITSRFALPSKAGDRTRQPTAFLQGLYPDGKQGFAEPAVTSMVRIVPVVVEESAGVMSFMDDGRA